MLSGAAHAGMNIPVAVNPGPSPSFAVWIKLIITFHRPKTQCKTGFGICFDVELGTDKLVGSGSNFCPAQARISEAGQLELMVSESDLQKYENGSTLPYFKKGSVTFEDSYTFSETVTRLLGVAGPVTIKPGSYRVVYDASAGTYTIDFPI